LVNINVNRVTGSSGQTQLGGTAGGNLTFGGSPGDQGQTLIVGQQNGQTFRVNGTTNLGPTGNVQIVTNTDTFLAGQVTGAGTLVKEGTSNLFLGPTTSSAGIQNSLTGGIDLLAGGLVAPGTGTANGNITANPLGNGTTINMVGGTLFLRAEFDNT